MQDYIKKYVKTIRLNSFHPLCRTELGLNATKNFNFPPFIDASCRREPDFENPFPSITSLCRQEKFAPHLQPNDIVVYITTKGKWFTDYDHYRLIAILEVSKRVESHLQAKSWYSSNNLPIPSNCMVADNPPHLFDETAGNYDNNNDLKKYLEYPIEKKKIVGENRVKIWDREYMAKSKKWGSFIITKPIFIDLIDPPILDDKTVNRIFQKKINTRTPNKITVKEFTEIAKLAYINFINPRT